MIISSRISITQLRITLVALLYLLGALLSSAWGILEIEVTQGIDNAIPIGFVQLDREEQLLPESTQITGIVAKDLGNSGRFKPVFLGKNELSFSKLKAKHIEVVVQGSITKHAVNNEYQVAIKVLDSYNQNVLMEKIYSGLKGDQIRKFAHRVSDEIYERILGDKGIFATKIAYVLVKGHNKAKRFFLQVSDSDGHNTHDLLSSAAPLMSPCWSPDGKKLAYVSFEGNRSAIYSQELATGKREIISKLPGINGAPAWSPDGSKIALVLTKTGYPKIYVLNLRDRQLQQITDGWSLDTEPSWAADGRSLLFTSNRGGSPQIYRVMLASKKIERISFNGNYNARAHFVPNRDAIVMLRREQGLFTIAFQEIGSEYVTLLAAIGANESPSIAPNGKMVIYATNQANRGVLASSSIDGKIRLLLPAVEGEVREPAWSPFLT